MADLEIHPAQTALVLIDLQNAIVGRDTAPYPAADVVARGKQLADAFRAKGSPIVWVNVNVNDFLSLPVDEPSPRPAQPVPAHMMDIADAAGKQPGDLLVTKRHWGAFAQTDLEQQLRDRGITTVVLTGIATNMGVESTARQGTGLGFAFVVVEDACTTFSSEMQDFAFTKIFPRLASVRTTAQVLKALA
jgi:nicotinamidase-related amidase